MAMQRALRIDPASQPQLAAAWIDGLVVGMAFQHLKAAQDIEPVGARREGPVVSFTCPRCGMTSHHPRDVEEGYCGNCHGWTRGEDRPDRQRHHLAGSA